LYQGDSVSDLSQLHWDKVILNMNRSQEAKKPKSQYNTHDEFIAVVEGMLSVENKVYRELKLKHVLDRME